MAILENAKKSIRLGMEDYHSSDPDRVLSAIRNLYAGLLLLFKHTILELASDGQDDTLIRSKVLPVMDNEEVTWEAKGKATIDVQEIKERFKSLKLTKNDNDINWDALAEVQKIRNDIEHLYSTESVKTMKEVIANSLELVTGLCTHCLDISPMELLGRDCWQSMLKVQKLYHDELEKAHASLEKLDWGAIPNEELFRYIQCLECYSSLVGAHPDQDGNKPYSASYICHECEDEPSAERLLLRALENWDENTAYHRVTGGEGDLCYTCHGCGNDSYLEAYEECLVCPYELDYSECRRCGDRLTIEDQHNSGVCGYCQYRWDKMKSE